MSDPRRVPCRKCAKPIIFVMSRKQRAIPCDPDLVTHALKPGVVVVTPDGQVLRGTEESKETSVQGYISHFSSCPYAEDFRKPKDQSSGGR
jgi:hypothetical protein